MLDQSPMRQLLLCQFPQASQLRFSQECSSPYQETIQRQLAKDPAPTSHPPPPPLPLQFPRASLCSLPAGAGNYIIMLLYSTAPCLGQIDTFSSISGQNSGSSSCRSHHNSSYDSCGSYDSCDSCESCESCGSCDLTGSCRSVRDLVHDSPAAAAAAASERRANSTRTGQDGRNYNSRVSKGNVASTAAAFQVN